MQNWISSLLFNRNILPALLLLLPVAVRCQAKEAVCQNGVGHFTAVATTGVSVSVGTYKVNGFANRDCESTLSWQGQQLTIIPHASQIDIDAMGIDLGLGAPVLALQTKLTDVDRVAVYHLYSLNTPPHLLREITGGDLYSAADTELNGHVEIWTHDASAIDGFEGLPLSAFDFPPTLVLRFEKHRLIDVSAEFQPEYDRQIAQIKSTLTADQLNAFKSSDGALAQTVSSDPAHLHLLMRTKIGLLEIVFAYLYSDRERDAWQYLSDNWPAADSNRIRAAIVTARAQGMLRQVDGTEAGQKRFFRNHQSAVYKAPTDINKKSETPSTIPMAVLTGPGSMEITPNNAPSDAPSFIADTAPKEIHLSLAAIGTEADTPLEKQILVHLIIDEAGKVYSIRYDGHLDSRIKNSTADWRFIPAYKNGRPVACSLDYNITSPK